jgi:flagellar capping protein FliD
MAYFEAMGDYHGERASSRLHERDNERPFTHRDFERAIALIRAAGDEITTFREASVAFRGIREQLSIMTRVFATAVAIAIACFGYFFITTNEIAKAVTRLETRVDERFVRVDERFDAVDTRLDRIDTRFDGIDKRLDRIDKRFDGMDKRLDALTAAVERLQPQKQGTLEY